MGSGRFCSETCAYAQTYLDVGAPLDLIGSRGILKWPNAVFVKNERHYQIYRKKSYKRERENMLHLWIIFQWDGNFLIFFHPILIPRVP